MLISQERELSTLLPTINRAQSYRLHLTQYFVTRLVLKKFQNRFILNFNDPKQISEGKWRGYSISVSGSIRYNVP